MNNKPTSLFDPGTLQTMGAIAASLADASLLPEHLRGTGHGASFKALPVEVRRANVMLIVNAARLFEMDPFQLANESYVLHGKMDMSGKVYAAIFNARGGGSKLSYAYDGHGDDRHVIVSACVSGDSRPREVVVHVLEARTFEKSGGVKQQWTKDVDQMLAYHGARKWVRRHCPECLLGLVDTADEVTDLADQPVVEASQAALEHAGPSPKYVAILKKALAASSQLDTKLLANEAQRARMSEDERQGLLDILRKRYAELKPPAISDRVEALHHTQPTESPETHAEAKTPDESNKSPGDDTQADKRHRWFRTLETAADYEGLMSSLAEMDADEGLTDKSRATLAKLGSRLIAEFQAAI